MLARVQLNLMMEFTVLQTVTRMGDNSFFMMELLRQFSMQKGEAFRGRIWESECCRPDLYFCSRVLQADKEFLHVVLVSPALQLGHDRDEEG